MVLNQQGDRRCILYGTLDCRELPAERGEEQGAIRANVLVHEVTNTIMVEIRYGKV